MNQGLAQNNMYHIMKAQPRPFSTQKSLAAGDAPPDINNGVGLKSLQNPTFELEIMIQDAGDS
jgi:hypothetical protein